MNSPGFLFAERHVAEETTVRLLDSGLGDLWLGRRDWRQLLVRLALFLLLFQLFVPLFEELFSQDFGRVADKVRLRVLLQSLVVREHLGAEIFTRIIKKRKLSHYFQKYFASP